jgi:hypothetical protein
MRKTYVCPYRPPPQTARHDDSARAGLTRPPKYRDPQEDKRRTSMDADGSGYDERGNPQHVLQDHFLYERQDGWKTDYVAERYRGVKMKYDLVDAKPAR